MKIVEPSIHAVLQKPGLQGVYEQIERAARVCYKSEGLTKYDENGNSTTAKDFVNKIVNVFKHRSVAEHGTIYLKMHSYNQIVQAYMNNPYSRVVEIGNFSDISKYYERDYYITTNYRVIVEHGWFDDLKYMCEPTEYHVRRQTYKIVAPISITRELNRHRCSSISEMSTRYCDFSKDKFDRELSFCKPVWWNENNLNQNCTDKWSKEDWFMYSCKASETAYLNMRELGATPEEAREVLLLDTITEAYYTAFEDDWKTIVSMRTAPTAHPNMVAILNKIKHLYQ